MKLNINKQVLFHLHNHFLLRHVNNKHKEMVEGGYKGSLLYWGGGEVRFFPADPFSEIMAPKI